MAQALAVSFLLAAGLRQDATDARDQTAGAQNIVARAEVLATQKANAEPQAAHHAARAAEFEVAGAAAAAAITAAREIQEIRGERDSL